MDTLLSHAGIIESDHNAAMAPPLHLATTYTRPADGQYLPDDKIYGRMDNPTRELLEATVGRLECHGDVRFDETTMKPTCAAFSSGLAAVSSILLTHQAPIRVFLHSDVYHGTSSAMADVMSRVGVSTERIDFTNAAEVEAAATSSFVSKDEANTGTIDSNKTNGTNRIFWMETPSNPQCQLIDIEATCDMIRSIDNTATTVVDSTLAPPCLVQPLRVSQSVGFGARRRTNRMATV